MHSSLTLLLAVALFLIIGVESRVALDKSLLRRGVHHYRVQPKDDTVVGGANEAIGSVFEVTDSTIDDIGLSGAI